MTPDWHPDAGRCPAHKPGVPLVGPPRHVIWMTSGDNPEHVSALLVAQRQNSRHSQPHIVWNPRSGELIQMIAADHGNRKYPPSHPASRSIAVLVVCEEGKAFTEYSCVNLHTLMSFIRDLLIPDSWPSGPPYSGQLRTASLRAAGHYAASTIAGSSYQGPGPIDIERLTYE